MQSGNYKRIPVNRLEPMLLEPTSTEAEVAVRKSSWGDTAKGWEERLESILAEHPKLAIAAAAAAGLALGWMVKRR